MSDDENDDIETGSVAVSDSESSESEGKAEVVTQINSVYNEREDRIVLRANSNLDREFNLWITFKIFRLLEEAFDKIDDLVTPENVSGETREAVKEFQREETLRKAQFTRGYENKHLEPVFGESPLLVDSLDVKLRKDSKVVVLVFMGEGKQCAIPLTKEALIPTRHLLERSAIKAGWIKSLSGKSELDKQQQDSISDGETKVFH